MTDVVRSLAETPQRPQFVQVKEAAPARSYGAVPRLGIRPSYGDEGEGVLLGGVADGGAEHEPGLRVA